MLDGEPRVAVPLEDQVAVEHVSRERAGEVGLGLPRVARPEQLERRERRDQLHHRRGIERLAGVERERGLAGVDVLHEQRDRRLRDAGARERGRDRWRQDLGGVDPRRQGRDGRDGEGELRAAARAPGDAKHAGEYATRRTLSRTRGAD